MVREEIAKTIYTQVARARDAKSVKVSATVEPSPVKRGAPVDVRIAYTNASGRPVAMKLGHAGAWERFRFKVLDGKGGDAEGPPGRSPCCDPKNPTIVCNGTPVENDPTLGMVGERPDTFLLTPDGVATHAVRMDLRRYKWGPVDDGCARKEVGSLPPGTYAIEIELPTVDDGSIFLGARFS